MEGGVYVIGVFFGKNGGGNFWVFVVRVVREIVIEVGKMIGGVLGRGRRMRVRMWWLLGMVVCEDG